MPLGTLGELLARDRDSFAWIGLYEPDDGVLERLQEQFGLHDLAIEDAHKAHQRPKLEGYGNSFFLVASTAQVVDRRCLRRDPRVLRSALPDHGAARRPLSYAAAARIEREPELLALGPAFGLYAVLDAIVDNYVPIVDEFSHPAGAGEGHRERVVRRDTVIRLYDLSAS